MKELTKGRAQGNLGKRLPWRGIVIVLAMIKVAAGTLATVAGLWAPEVHLTSRLPVFLLYVLCFTSVGLFLITHGDRSRAATMLGFTLLLSGTSFADAAIARTAPYSAVAASLTLWIFVRLEALVPFCFWRFAAAFPSSPLRRRERRILTAASLLSLTAGLFFVVIHLLFWLGERSGDGLPWLLAMRPLRRDLIANLYWPILFLFLIPALIFLLYRVLRAPSSERRRTRLFALALVGGATPMLLLTFGQVLLPPVARLFESPRTAFAPLLFYDLGLLSIPFTTAYAVVVHRVLDIRSVARGVIQYLLAKVTIVGLSLLPFVALGAYLLSHRHLPLVAIAAGPRLWVLLSLGLLGLIVVPQRRRSVNWLDRRFFREQYDSETLLASLVEKVGTITTEPQLARVLQSEIQQALHLKSLSLLLALSDGPGFAAFDAHGPDLAADSEIPGLLQSTREPLLADFEARVNGFNALPEDARAWFCDNEVEAVLPLFSLDGDLLAVLALGPKRSELPLSRTDLRLLKAVSRSAAVVLENTRLRSSSGDALRTLTPAPGSGGAVGLETPSPRSTSSGLCGQCQRASFADASGACPHCGGDLGRLDLPMVLNGKYRLRRLVGRGGMGVVFEAWDLSLDRAVALKTLPEGSLRHAALLRAEARAVASVRHPNLATIHGAETWRHRPILVFEFLEGGTLSRRLRRGPFEYSNGIDLGCQLTEALVHIHSRGILHRDIKPSNIGFDGNGVPKLMDFGVARLIDRIEAPTAELSVSAADDEASVTPSSPEEWVGTPFYMSPEGLRGRPADFTSDLWSFSVVLYEIFTGLHPFRSGTVAETLARIRSTTFHPPSFHLAHLAGLDSCFSRWFSKRVVERPRSAAELLAELERLRALGSEPLRSG